MICQSLSCAIENRASEAISAAPKITSLLLAILTSPRPLTSEFQIRPADRFAFGDRLTGFGPDDAARVALVDPDRRAATHAVTDAELDSCRHRSRRILPVSPDDLSFVHHPGF